MNDTLVMITAVSAGSHALIEVIKPWLKAHSPYPAYNQFLIYALLLIFSFVGVATLDNWTGLFDEITPFGNTISDGVAVVLAIGLSMLEAPVIHRLWEVIQKKPPAPE